VFAQDELEVAHNLRLNLGVRHDEYTSFGGTTNPRLGLIYQPRQRTSLKLLYGQAFRAPSAYELYYQDGWAQKANPELGPETIGSGEVVWEEFIGRGLQTSVSIYTYRVAGLIGQITDPSDGLTVFENVDEVTASGIELEVQGRWWRQIEGYASWSLQETEDATIDQPYPNSPRCLGVVRLSVPFSGERLWVSPELLYRGSVETLDNRTLDGAFVANLTILATEVLKGVDLSLTVRNLFDESYRVPGGQEHLQDSLEQDGRTVRARAVVRF
jgi:outer membrane receptor for ferrienterochelin and colicins